MNVSKNMSTPLLMSPELSNPPEIEKILDTTLTKDNKRYYKVKWIKVTWESEDDIAYFNNLIEAFWTEYTKECLLQSETESCSNDLTSKDACQYNNLDNIGNKEIYNYNLLQQHNDVVPDSHQTSDKHLLSHTPVESNLLSISSHEMLSPSNCSSHHVAAPSDMLHSHITNNELDMIPSFSQDCDYSLDESNLLKSNEEQNQTAKMIETDVTPAKQLSHTLLCKDIEKTEPNKSLVVYKCSFCAINFESKEKYLEHEKSHADRKCIICGKEFQRLGHLKVHMHSHNNIRPFECKECGKAFHEKCSLNKHQQVHSNVRNHECSTCGMKFKRAQHLRRHNEVHKQNKQFTCLLCNKQFLQKSALEAHINVHTGNKPFKCKVCSHSFADRATLRRHTLTHAKEKPYQCLLCSKEFCRQNSLKLHMVSKHKDSEESATSSESTEKKSQDD
ncbi:zinc finger protein 1 homolog [Clytia hemisphaerica]|uniref:C2H2-type domain-containing protein n=2 Tax=Clytia hemisphaerica TaxID=252671 RepID=A0A7M5VG30_9CNID